MMIQREPGRNHLKLVAGAPGGVEEGESIAAVQQGEQLRLPFEREDLVVLMHETEIHSTSAFIAFIEHYRPKWLLDIRVAPRMDFIAPSRSLALKSLSELQIQYVDVLGRIQNTSEWLMFVESLLRSAHGFMGPYVFIFDDRSALSKASAKIPSILRALDSARSINVSTYSKDLIAL